MLLIKHELLRVSGAQGSHQAPADKCCLNEKTFLLCSWLLNNDVDKYLPDPADFQIAFFFVFFPFFFSPLNGKITIGQITNFWHRIISHKDKAYFLISCPWPRKIFSLILKRVPETEIHELKYKIWGSFIDLDIKHDWWDILFYNNA